MPRLFAFFVGFSNVLSVLFVVVRRVGFAVVHTYYEVVRVGVVLDIFYRRIDIALFVVEKVIAAFRARNRAFEVFVNEVVEGCAHR